VLPAGATSVHRVGRVFANKRLDPLGYPRQPVPVLIDRGFVDLEEIYAGGGADDVMLRLRVTDLLQATGARLTDVI